MAKKKGNTASPKLSRRVEYDASTQAPLARYFGAPDIIDGATEAEFENDFKADNKYTRREHIKRFFLKYKKPITVACVVSAVIAVLLVIIF